ncbi:hypothetical protein AVEN_15963-1 [Araneus ventricosus]|uniref:Uncharacterized protein n=1 Tax=Araneus ventricosus TaxID=182803 RepID=A0A4Y2ID66_ARAVE|nr:hypothetical protein AVEN_15963-1 [Araneus ventricosus]
MIQKISPVTKNNAFAAVGDRESLNIAGKTCRKSPQQRIIDFHFCKDYLSVKTTDVPNLQPHLGLEYQFFIDLVFLPHVRHHLPDFLHPQIASHYLLSVILVKVSSSAAAICVANLSTSSKKPFSDAIASLITIFFCTQNYRPSKTATASHSRSSHENDCPSFVAVVVAARWMLKLFTSLIRSPSYISRSALSATENHCLLSILRAT